MKTLCFCFCGMWSVCSLAPECISSPCCVHLRINLSCLDGADGYGVLRHLVDTWPTAFLSPTSQHRSWPAACTPAGSFDLGPKSSFSRRHNECSRALNVSGPLKTPRIPNLLQLRSPGMLPEPSGGCLATPVSGATPPPG